MDDGRLAKYSRLTVITAGVIVFGYLFIKRALMLVLPFFIAWGVAFAVRPLSKKLSLKTRIPERLVRTALAVIICLSVLSLAFFLLWRLVLQGWRILTSLSENGTVGVLLEQIASPDGKLRAYLPTSLRDALSHALTGAVEKLAESFASFATGFAARIPDALLFIIITIIANIYFSFDLDHINAFFRARLPEKLFSALVRFKDSFLSVGVSYLKAYLIIMLLIFALVFTGLSLLGVKYAFFISTLIAVADVLPVIGVGTVLIPWGVFQIFLGSRSLGIGLIVLFLITEFVRQLAEPKIVGKHLGLHPVVSLVLLWGAYSLFGILGILIMPVFVVTVNSLLGKNDPPKVKKRSGHKADGA